MAAAKVLEEYGIQITVADARFCKPLDGELVKQLARQHEILLTVEEGSIGGFSSHVSHFLGLNGLLDGNLKVFNKQTQNRTSLIYTIKYTFHIVIYKKD